MGSHSVTCYPTLLELNVTKTYQFTILCKGDYVTHPKQHKSFY